MQGNPKDTKENPGPWPWYVLLVTGLALTGFFPWLMISWAFYQRRRRRAAIEAFAINLATFISFGWVLLRIELAWWWLLPFVYLFNLLWAFTAWFFQRKSIGPAVRRYVLTEWKSWIVPLLIGALIGVCMATVFSVSAAFENRIEMRETLDTLDREPVLWDFFKYVFLGLPAGLLLGFWWAGQRKQFRTSHLITFLPAFASTIVLWLFFEYLFVFLIHKGIPVYKAVSDFSDWALVPPWVSGVRMYLLRIQSSDISALLVVPLLFGAVSRIRDFGKRALLIPLAFLCTFPVSFAGNERWSGIQDQIAYEMSSSDPRARASAHKWAEIMLKRYPNHLQWPGIMEDMARYYYEEGEFGKSKAFYHEIIDRCSDSNQWYWVVGRARAALEDPDFGKPSLGPRLEIPTADYEEYLTQNWMTLLSVILYWEGPEVSESKVKIKLKGLSKSDDKIRLNPLDGLADLDDAARCLGYEVLILRAGLPRVRALISAGIPLIHPSYKSFNLIFGFDESRSTASAYSFRKLSQRLRKEARKEAKEILAIEEEGRGESTKRLARIANETYGEYSLDYWKNPALRHIGPLIAIVFPVEKTDAIVKALNAPLDVLKRESDGYLATLIGFSYLNHADPVHAVEWAKVGAKKTMDPMPWYVAHLARVFWESRDQKVKSTITLQEQFPELARIFSYFNEPENLAFLEGARLRFEADLDANRIPWIILHTYTPMLDRSDPLDLELIIKAIRGSLSVNPAYHSYWQYLADTYEWAGDIPGMVDALKGLISAKPTDFKAKLHLAYGHVLLEQYADAKAVLDETGLSGIKYDADYPFCRGAIAEWQGDMKGALEKYEKAVEMRRYKPIYHLRYGKLLLQEGQTKKAKKLLEWAARISAGEKIKREAEMLLSNMWKAK